MLGVCGVHLKLVGLLEDRLHMMEYGVAKGMELVSILLYADDMALMRH
jgi:hypothetical protein